jgi:hypothetical protein
MNEPTGLYFNHYDEWILLKPIDLEHDVKAFYTSASARIDQLRREVEEVGEKNRALEKKIDFIIKNLLLSSDAEGDKGNLPIVQD